MGFYRSQAQNSTDFSPISDGDASTSPTPFHVEFFGQPTTVESTAAYSASTTNREQLPAEFPQGEAIQFRSQEQEPTIKLSSGGFFTRAQHLKNHGGLAVSDSAMTFSRSAERSGATNSAPSDESNLETESNASYRPKPLYSNTSPAHNGFWSNALTDGGMAAIALAGAGIVASVVCKNPNFARMGLATGEGTLTLGSKVALGTGVFTGTTLGRHIAHESKTGESESWGASALHSTAGLAAVGGLWLGRGQAAKLFTNESKILGGLKSEVAAVKEAPPVAAAARTPEAAVNSVFEPWQQKYFKVVPDGINRNTAADVLKRMNESNTPVEPDVLRFLLERKSLGL